MEKVSGSLGDFLNAGKGMRGARMMKTRFRIHGRSILFSAVRRLRRLQMKCSALLTIACSLVFARLVQGAEAPGALAMVILVERFDMPGEQQKVMYGGFMRAAVARYGTPQPSR